VHWTRARIAEFGGDPKNLHLTGHSAGAHLAVMMALTPDLSEVIRSVTALSGLYDLAPVSLCSMQQDLRLTESEIVALSPMNKALRSGLKLLIGAGAEETTAFRWHSATFGERCKANGLDCAVMMIPGHHHYSVVGVLCEDDPLRMAWLELCRK
jgi:arylformamidase